MMTEWKLFLMGIGLVGLGIFNTIWYILKLISCIMIAIFVTTNVFHLTGYYWWFSSIIVFCILEKIVFFRNSLSSNTFNELNEKYQEKVTDWNNREIY